MSPKEQAAAVKLLRRWRTIANASKTMPITAEERLQVVAIFEELARETNEFIEHEDPDNL